MGADNYAICPRCVVNWTTELANREQGLDNLYGRVDQATYEEVRAELDVFRRMSGVKTTTFTETYEIYNDDVGTVSIDYLGQCGTCGLRVVFDHEIDLMKEAG